MQKVTIKDLLDVALTQQTSLLGDLSAFEFMLDYNDKYAEYDNMIALYFSEKELRRSFAMIPLTQIFNLFKNDVKSILTINYEKYTRYLGIHNATYNPIENYDRRESLYESQNGYTEKRNGIVSHDFVKNGSEVTTYNHGEATATNTSSQTPYDSTSFKAVAKNDVVNKPFTDSDTLTYNNRQDTTTDNYNNLSNEIDLERLNDNHIHGNIGVTTNQQMLDAERNFWNNFNLLYIIFSDIFAELTKPFWKIEEW